MKLRKWSPEEKMAIVLEGIKGAISGISGIPAFETGASKAPLSPA